MKTLTSDSIVIGPRLQSAPQEVAAHRILAAEAVQHDADRALLFAAGNTFFSLPSFALQRPPSAEWNSISFVFYPGLPSWAKGCAAPAGLDVSWCGRLF